VDYGFVTITRCIFEGSGAGAAQYGITTSVYSMIHLTDCAFFNLGKYPIYLSRGACVLENVNLGIEIDNASHEISIQFGGGSNGNIVGRDVKFGGKGGYVTQGGTINTDFLVSIENYQKVLGDHKVWFVGGEYISTAVSGETPNKKLSDTILKITPNVNLFAFSEQDWKVKIPLGEINADAGSQTFKFWIYNGLGVTLNDGDALADLNLAAEYVSSYGDTTAYTMSTIRSGEHTIAVPDDADDWDYLSVTPTIATESKVRLWLEISVYSAAGNLIVDPQVVIT